MNDLILKVEGMHCKGCAIAVKSEMEELEFIKEVSVDLDKKQVLIKYDKNIDMKKIEKIIVDLGFKLLKQ